MDRNDTRTPRTVPLPPAVSAQQIIAEVAVLRKQMDARVADVRTIKSALILAQARLDAADAARRADRRDIAIGTLIGLAGFLLALGSTLVQIGWL